MPSKISFKKAEEALYECIKDKSTPYYRMTREDFYDVMRGQGIASSKDALRTLWAQARFADWNVYSGPLSTIVLVSIASLGEEVRPRGGVYTHIHTHTEEVA